jgi:2-polyprenyl-3-methyl-5-hydroxy-6-metoxy-1,4-benzoquinol methylase
MTDVRQQYVQDLEAFQREVARLGLGDVRGYYWYHTVDLGDGLVTPGMYDYRQALPIYRFPDSMRGMRALDVGSATGFFAFEFERRGARVVSVDLPSLDAWDRFPGQTLEDTVRKVRRMLEPCRLAGDPPLASRSAGDLYTATLEGPFGFCHRRLGSSVERRHSTVYDLSAAVVGGADFDLVFAGDLVVHTLEPVRALAALASLCRGTLVLSQTMFQGPAEPAMLYVGGTDPAEDDFSWWLPNRQCLEQVLLKLGFRTVEEVGRNRGLFRPTAHPYDRTVLRATR